MAECNDVSENSSLQEFYPAEHEFAEAGESQAILFTNYFSSKSAFRDKMMAPLEKMYQQDKEFVDYVSKYCHLVKRFANDLERLRGSYEKTTSKNSKTFAVSQAYGAFSSVVQQQSSMFTEFADNIFNQCFGVQTRETLSQHGRDLIKASDEVIRADKAWSDSIAAVKTKRKACASALQECDRVEEKRPDTQTFSKELLKYKNNNESKAYFLDRSIGECLTACTDSNSIRLKFEFALEEALGISQTLASKRVTLVTENLNKYIELHDELAGKFADSCDKLRSATQNINPAKEELAFVQANTVKGKQVLEPELIIFDLPGMRTEDQKKDDTKLYSIRQMRKQVCYRTIRKLRERESIVVKNLDLVSTLLDRAEASTHGMQEKFTDKKKSYVECVNLLNELDILQVSIQNVISDVYTLNKNNSPRDVPIYLAQFVTTAGEAKHGHLYVIRPPLEYYQNLDRDVSEMQLPVSIQQELGSSSNEKQSKNASPETTMMPVSRTGTVDAGPQNAVTHASNEHRAAVTNSGSSSGNEPTTPAADTDEFEEFREDSWQAIVRYDFKPRELYPTDDISYMLPISSGERITVIESLENDWYYAENQTGDRGHVPQSYLQPA